MTLSPLKFLVGWQGYAAAALLAASVAAAGAWTVQGWRYDARIAGMQRDQAQALAERNQKAADAQSLARAVEHARQNTIEGAVNEANEKAAHATADATASAAVAGQLRRELARIREHRAAGNTTAANSGSSAADPIGVLAVVLGEIDDRSGILAQYADQSRIAGMACEAAYDGVRAAGK